MQLTDKSEMKYYVVQIFAYSTSGNSAISK